MTQIAKTVAIKTAKKPIKRKKPKTWLYANGHKIVRESTRRYRTYVGATKGGIITFASTKAADDFTEKLDHVHRYSYPIGAKPQAIWRLDPDVVVENPKMPEGYMPRRVTVKGEVRLIEPAFDRTEASSGYVAITAYGCSLHMSRPTFHGAVNLYSESGRHISRVTLKDSTLRLQPSARVDFALIEGVELAVPSEGDLRDAIVRDGAIPLFFTGVGDEEGTLSIYVNNHGCIRTSRGCFTGTADEFLTAVKEKGPKNFWRTHYPRLINLGKAYFKDAAKNIADVRKNTPPGEDF